MKPARRSNRAPRPARKPGAPTTSAKWPRAPGEQINLTDPDARLMRKSKRESYTQSYNCQAVVDADGSQLIVGQRVSRCASDSGEMEADPACNLKLLHTLQGSTAMA